MGMPRNIRNFLQQSNLPYEVIRHDRTNSLLQAANACQLPIEQLARAVVLADAEGLLMVVLPAHHLLDFEALCILTERELQLCPADRLAEIFDDCEAGSLPPLANSYGLNVIIDAALANWQDVVFEPGSHTALIRMSGEAFQSLHNQAQSAVVSLPPSVLSDLGSQQASDTLDEYFEQLIPSRVRRSLEDIHELPALPVTATRILHLASNPLSNAKQLAAIIEQDPSLSAQILRYANSSLYGYAGRIKDLQSAIARVLGFEFVLNLSLGLTIGKTLRIPPDGPFGLNAFWKHSVYAARLVELLARQLPGKQRPQRGTAYLAGLIQNIGRLVLGHAFQPEFYILNQFAQSNPNMPSHELEKNILGVTHDQIGAWLMESWAMPDELIIAVRHHHDEGYWEKHAVYPQLIFVANRLLALYGISNMEKPELPIFAMEMLGLEETTVRLLTEQILANSEELDDLAKRLAA
jgi:HD-like signal output (HDOD) protein/prolyl-tRNA editing enzyme YbaK/EbsC (Cys-tRNA(Pro) deacylase)